MFRFVRSWFVLTPFRSALLAITLLLPVISFASAKEFFAPNEVWIRIAPYQYNVLNQRTDASIPYPTGNAGLDAMMAEYGVTSLKPMTNHIAKALADPTFRKEGLDRYYLFRFEDKKKWSWDADIMFRLAGRMRSIPGIEASEPVGGVELNYTPNDWNLAGRVMWGLDSMHCKQAWDTQRGRPTVLAISIDTGVDYNHPDLQGAFQVNTAEDVDLSGLPDSLNTNGNDPDGNGYNDDVIGYNFVSHDYTAIAGASAATGEQYTRSNRPMDVYGHGTHTCGILAARTDNSTGVPSASFNVKTLAVKAGFAFIYQSQLYATLYFDDVTLALQYATDMGARVVTMSFGSTGIDTAFRSMVNYAYAHNVAIFASAGNDSNTTMQYPAAFLHVMGVAATTTGNLKADYSTYGSWVKISAPGSNIWSTMAVNVYNPDPYVAWDGTSMACPNAGAVAALVISRNFNLTNDQLDTVLASTATNINTINPTYSGLLGAGLVNAQAAVNAVGPSIITALTPRGGEVWWTSQIKTVRWLAPDSIPNVRIELNRNYPSPTWETLITSTPNDSQQTWTVAGDTTSNARVRVLDAAHLAIGDTTRGNFAIYRPWVQVISPSTGDTLREGVPGSITWNSAGIDSVDIDFMRTYPSGTWERLVSRYPNHGSWGWLTVVGPATSTARVRVSKAGDTSFAGISSGNVILITPGITMLSPANNDTLHIGTFIRINYGTAGIAHVNIDLKRNYPAGNWETIATNATANGNNSWVVTAPAANNCRIRVRNSTDSTMGDTTHGTFVIRPSAVLVMAPNGGEVWTQNVTYTMSWKRLGFAGTIIQVKPDYPNGAWSTITTRPAGDSLFYWTVTSAASTNARVRMLNTADTTQGDTSDANFTIARPTITVTYPANQDTIFNGLAVNFTWQSLGIVGSDQIAINRNYPSGAWEVLGTAVDSTHNFRWTPNLPLSDNMRIRVRAVFDTTLLNYSTAENVITTGTMHIVSPNGGEVWPIQTVQTLRWNSNMHGNIRIELNRNYPSAQWDVLYWSYDNRGSYQWTVGGVPSNHNRFRISYAGAPAFVDTSDGDFTIGMGSGVLEHWTGVPTEFSLYPAAPNPFNPETQFQVATPVEARLTVGVYNLMGQRITTLADGIFPAGFHTFRWNSIAMNGNSVPTGLYFVRVTSGSGWIGTQKLMLMK